MIVDPHEHPICTLCVSLFIESQSNVTQSFCCHPKSDIILLSMIPFDDQITLLIKLFISCEKRLMFGIMSSFAPRLEFFPAFSTSSVAPLSLIKLGKSFFKILNFFEFLRFQVPFVVIVAIS